MKTMEGIAAGIVAGNPKVVEELTAGALAEGWAPDDILSRGFLAGMSVIGTRFKNNEIFIPEVLISAQAMKAGMSLLSPLLAGSGRRSSGKVVLGTVKGDLHDIGKNIVGMLLEGAGFDVIDLGYDVSNERFAEAVAREGAHILGLSALLTTTMVSMGDVIRHLETVDLRKGIKVMVGGAPVTQVFADEIGADGYAPDAASAADLAASLMKR